MKNAAINYEFIDTLLSMENTNPMKVADLLCDLALDSLYDGDTDAFNYLDAHALEVYRQTNTLC